MARLWQARLEDVKIGERVLNSLPGKKYFRQKSKIRPKIKVIVKNPNLG